MNIILKIDEDRQWFVTLWLVFGKRKTALTLKVDTGCNALVLSHRTLNKLGISTNPTDLAKLPKTTGKLASGDTHTFRRLGKVTLYQDKAQNLQICNAMAICHTTKETHDLLGTEVLQQFNDITFSVKNKQLILLS